MRGEAFLTFQLFLVKNIHSFLTAAYIQCISDNLLQAKVYLPKEINQ